MELVPNWKTVLLKSWTVRLTAAGIAAPELLQLLADNIDAMPFSPEWKQIIRIGFMAAAILARPVQQRSISGG